LRFRRILIRELVGNLHLSGSRSSNGLSFLDRLRGHYKVRKHSRDFLLARHRAHSDRGYDGFGIRAVSAIINAQIKSGVLRFDTGQ
jgi:hypothetical protein